MIGFGCCVSSWDKLDSYVRPYVGSRPLFTVWGATSIAVAYNQIIDAFKTRDVEALVLLHDDLEVTDPRADELFISALEPDVALVGVAGARSCDTIAWWTGDVIGHQVIDGPRLLDFGDRADDVTALEGSILVLSPWALQNLRFDETYDDFHGYDCDIAMTAHRLGRRVRVVDVDTHHHVSLGFKSPESEASWRRADELYRRKWHASS